MIRTLTLAAVLGIAGCMAPEGPGGEGTDVANQTEDQGDAIFQMTSVESFAITIDPADIATLDAEVANIKAHWDFEHLAAKRTEVKATLTYKGTTVGAKIKIKGMASVQGFDMKPSLKIDLDEPLLGLKNLTLNSMTQDPTMVREALAYKMYDAVGIPVPRVGYSNVTINEKPYGLYVTLEAIDKHFFERKLGDTAGVMYESTYGGDLRESDIGTLKMVHQSEKTNPAEETDHARLKELIAAVNRPGDDVFFGATPMVDTEKFLSMMAMAYVIGDWDNYVTANNYRLYRHSQTGVWSFIPTGVDQTFQREMHPYRGYAERNSPLPILFEKCLGSAKCIAAYDHALERAMAAFQAPGGGLGGTLGRRVELIKASVDADPRKPFDAAKIEAERRTSLAVIAARPASIAEARKCVADGKEIFQGACAGLYLVDAGSKSCMNVNGSSRDDGGEVIIWGCETTSNGRWILQPVEGADVQLVAAHSGKCATVNGTAVIQKTCARTPDQIFTRKAVTGGAQYIGKQSGQCLDITATTAQSKLIAAPCGDPASTPNQLWTARASIFD